MADGLQVHQAAVGVQQNVVVAVRGNLTAATTAESSYQAARSLKTTRTTAQTVADSNGKAFIAAAKKTSSNHASAPSGRARGRQSGSSTTRRPSRAPSRNDRRAWAR